MALAIDWVRLGKLHSSSWITTPLREKLCIRDSASLNWRYLDQVGRGKADRSEQIPRTNLQPGTCDIRSLQLHLRSLGQSFKQVSWHMLEYGDGSVTEQSLLMQIVPWCYDLARVSLEPRNSLCSLCNAVLPRYFCFFIGVSLLVCLKSFLVRWGTPCCVLYFHPEIVIGQNIS